eukprot:1155282-Pelagomonas_calceolata.AAC.7
MLRACAADAGAPWLTARTSGPVAAMYSAFSDSSASAVPASAQQQRGARICGAFKKPGSMLQTVLCLPVHSSLEGHPHVGHSKSQAAYCKQCRTCQCTAAERCNHLQNISEARQFTA